MGAAVEIDGFRLALEACPTAMLLVDASGCVSFANETATLLFGYPDLRGKPVESLMPPELRGAHVGHRRGYESQPSPRKMGAGRDLEALRADGSRFPIEVALKPLIWEGERQVLCSLVDISERQALIREREALLVQGLRQERLHSLGLLASGIAHDFNNLLAAILGNIQVAMEASAGNTLAMESLVDALGAGQRAAELSDELMAYSGKGEQRLGEVDLALAARNLAGLLRKNIPDNVQVHLDLPGELPPVYADQNQVRQILMNLISNAVQAVGDAPGDVWVTASSVVLTEREEVEAGLVLVPGTYASLTVRDSGCGMSPETRARMFEAFFTTKATGHGLGLAATLGVLLAHGGGLRVHSALGQGSTITLLLPLAP